MKSSQIALSIDVEDWYHTPAISGSIFARYKSIDEFFKHWTGRYDYLTESTLETISLLKKHNINATFFVVADIVDRYPAIVQALRNSDHEIGCHGMHHISAIDPNTKKPFMSPDDWTEDVRSSKKKLEDTFGKEVTGYRAPGAYFGNWMVNQLSDLGFKYDSSIAYNVLYNKTNVKLSNIPRTPYFMSPKTLGPEKEKSIVELPWSRFYFLGLPFPAGGAFFYRLFGNTYFKMVLNQNLKFGDSMFYFHPLDLTREEFPLSSGRYRPKYWVNKGAKTATRLDKLFAHYKTQWTTCQEVTRKFLEVSDV